MSRGNPKETAMGATDERKRRAGAVRSEYQPTKKELEKAVGAIFPDDPPLVESGKGKQVKKEWEAWLKKRGT